MLWVLALLATPATADQAGVPGADTAPPDVRILLIEQQVERRHPEALEVVERTLREQPEAAHNLGLDYLHGRLLLLVGRRQEALQAFANTMGSAPMLGAHSRYRLAVEQEASGHPEVAAGLVATLLGSEPPKSLIAPAAQLLERAIADGGDCRLLQNLDPRRWGAEARRRLTLAVTTCSARSGDLKKTEGLHLGLLEEERRDEVALVAAERLAASQPGERRARSHLLLGLTFYNHREFERAIYHLTRTLEQLPTATGVSRREAFECRYALARSHFWMGRYTSAAATYEALAADTPSAARRAQVLYHRARCLELLGSWQDASAGFRSAYKTEPDGRWSGASLIATLRLEWLQGHEAEALAAYRLLGARRGRRDAARALLFMASSDLVLDRDDRAEGWLGSATLPGKLPEQELGYWRGRLAETRGQLADATSLYAEVLARNPYHPFAAAADRRLKNATMAPWARRLGHRLAVSSLAGELYRAWLLLPPSDPQHRRAARGLEQLLAADRAANPYLRLVREPAARWPLWQAQLQRPEEMLLTLGLFDEGGAVVLQHFPVTEPALAFTGSLMLAQSGETRRSLYIAEILAERIPRQLPPQLLDASYRRLLFPFGHRRLILRETGKRGVDPLLLAAIIREESRFDPRAVSPAAARGLTQFVLPTAQRIARKIQLAPITPRDLEQPEVAVALGAAYLEELEETFGGATHQAIAAYNAGERQALLWRRYCQSTEPEEYLTKVSFRETRGYLTKVLTSWRHYAELYGSEG